MIMISDKLVWIDIETTGVDEKVDLILEIAVIVTDNDLNELGYFFSIVGSCNPNLLIQKGSSQCETLERLRNIIGVDIDKGSVDRGLMLPCWEQHFNSGLIDDLKFAYDQGSSESISIEATENCIINFIAKHGIEASNSIIETPEGPKDVRPPLCGSSVHFDRQFLNRDMPNLMKLIHYRNIDASSIRECARRFSPHLEVPEVDSKHRAIDDLRDSVNLLRFFRSSGFLGI